MNSYTEAAMERAMKVQEVMLQAMSKKISWWQAAEILGISDRHMRRWRERYFDLNVHFHEKLGAEHQIRLSYRQFALETPISRLAPLPPGSKGRHILPTDRSRSYPPRSSRIHRPVSSTPAPASRSLS